MYPVLALATYICAYSEVPIAGSLLFPGTNQYYQFMTMFRKVIDENAEAFEKLRVLPKTLGSHSARKGALTLVHTGCTISPPMAAICI